MKTVTYNSTGANSAKFSSDLPELNDVVLRLDSKQTKVRHVHVRKTGRKYAQKGSPYARVNGRMKARKTKSPKVRPPRSARFGM